MAVLVALLSSLALGLASGCFSKSQPKSPPPTPFVCEESSDSDLRNLSRANNEFLIDLYAILDDHGSSSSDNIIISPFSIFTGLSLLHLGTAGDTKENFEKKLHFPTGKQKQSLVHQEGRKIIDSLEVMSRDADEAFILQTSNAVFLDDDFSIVDDYRKKVSCYYKSKITKLPLAENP